MTNNAEREAFEMARIAYHRETHIWPRISGLRAAIEAWQARAQASGVPDGKDAVNEIVSFVQTGTVVANGDIGSVLMWLPKDMIGKVVYLYDHTFHYALTPPKSASVPVERLEALTKYAGCFDSCVRTEDLADLIAEYK